MMWIAVTLLVVTAPPDSDAVPRSQKDSVVRQVSCCSNRSCGCALRYESANFVVRSHAGRFQASEVTSRCESLRCETQTKWLGKNTETNWQPRCEVVVHASQASYLSAAGAGARGTSGCSSLQVDKGKIILRRIDLLAEDEARARSALDHELTHIVLADPFVDKPLPRWADEGIATLADHDDKQTRHQRDLNTALRDGSTFRVGELLATEEYPAPHRFAAFYGQSASLVRFLSQRESPVSFVQFLEQSRTAGYDQALRDVYQIDGVTELERLWRSYAVADR